MTLSKENLKYRKRTSAGQLNIFSLAFIFFGEKSMNNLRKSLRFDHCKMNARSSGVTSIRALALS